MKTCRLLAALTAGLGLTAVVILVLAMCPGVVRADPGVRYVALDGNDTLQCDSIANRCRTVQRAVDVADPFDEVWVAQGTYVDAGVAVVIIGNKSLSIYGGWDGANAGVRDPQVHPTILDGQGVRQVVNVGAGNTVALEGFTVTNGVAPVHGAGLYARDANLTLRSMAFYSNVISTTVTGDPYGGGAMVEGGTLLVDGSTFISNSTWAKSAPTGGGLAISATLQATVENSVFRDNDAWHANGLYFFGDWGDGRPLILRRCRFEDNGWGHSPGIAGGGYGAAIQIIGGDAQVEDNTFFHNFGGNGAGAVEVYYTDLTMTRNVIQSNQSHYDTSGILIAYSSFTLTNNLFVDNESTYWWAEHECVAIDNGTGQMVHNTIARNDNTYGIKVWNGATVSLTNTILVSHTVGITVAEGSVASLEGTLWGFGPWANGDDWDGDGAILTGTVNLRQLPEFVDPDGGDYHITAGSVAVDAGVSVWVVDDVDREARPHDGDDDGIAQPDIGADELADYVFLPSILRR
jgi:hypothetical protein